MADEWSGMADMLTNLIEKYASDLAIDNFPDIAVGYCTEDERNKSGEDLK